MSRFAFGLILSGLLAAGCAGNTFEATIDGEEQQYDDISVELTKTAGLYRISAKGTVGDPQADGSSLQLVVDLDAAAVRAADKDVGLTVSGTTTFGASATDPATYVAGADQKAPVASLAASHQCKGCERKGNESQRWSGTIELTEVADDHLAAKLLLKLDGAIPAYDKKDGLKADFAVELDADIPAEPAE